MTPKFQPEERVTVSDMHTIKQYGKMLPLVGWVDHCEEILQGKRHMGWWVYIRPDGSNQPIVRYPQDVLCRVRLKGIR